MHCFFIQFRARQGHDMEPMKLKASYNCLNVLLRQSPLRVILSPGLHPMMYLWSVDRVRLKGRGCILSHQLTNVQGTGGMLDLSLCHICSFPLIQHEYQSTHGFPVQLVQWGWMLWTDINMWKSSKPEGLLIIVNYVRGRETSKLPARTMQPMFTTTSICLK